MPSHHPYLRDEEEALQPVASGVAPERTAQSSAPDRGHEAEVPVHASRRRAAALLAFGCLALGVALGCIAFAASHFLTALLEVGNPLTAALEALFGILLLGTGLSAGLAWAVLAAVVHGAGAGALLPSGRRAGSPASDRAVEVVLG